MTLFFTQILVSSYHNLLKCIMQLLQFFCTHSLAVVPY